MGRDRCSALEGTFQCPSISMTMNISSCTFVSTDPKGIPSVKLMDNLLAKYNSQDSSAAALTVGLYSIHSWAPVSKWPHHPDRCALPTDVNIVESGPSTDSGDCLNRVSATMVTARRTRSPAHYCSGLMFPNSNFLNFLTLSRGRKIKGVPMCQHVMVMADGDLYGRWLYPKSRGTSELTAWASVTALERMFLQML